MRIVKWIDNELVSEIAVRCADETFNDFTKEVYAQCAYRAKRKLAKQYDILQAQITLKVETKEDIDKINLPSNFHSVNDVHINNRQRQRVINEIEKDIRDSYQLTFEDGVFSISYKNAAVGDEIKVFYNLTGIDASEDYDFILPDMYYEELLKQALIKICELGIAKFQNQRKEKYTDLYKIYSQQNNPIKDSALVKDDPWIEIQPHRYP